MVKYLSERFDLTDPRVAFLGASAGSLMVVLAACGVPAGTECHLLADTSSLSVVLAACSW